MFKRQITTVVMIGLLTLAGSACGSRSDSNGGNGSPDTSADQPVVATMPAANFSSVGEQSVITNTVGSDSADDSGPDLALGERVYGNHCAECHGENGTGASAASVIGLELEAGAFEDLLRTGGDLGPDHLFGTQKVSPGGLEALYAYISSLAD